MAKRKSFAGRFWPKVRRTAGCWEWVGCVDAKGYGRYSSKQRAHREAYEQFVGTIPQGMCVLHRCDNPPCVNPAHLFLGTKRDNNADRNNKGRTSRVSRNVGSEHGLSVIDESTVIQIRKLRALGAPLRDIGQRYGISDALVSLVARGKRWAHVGDDHR